MWYMGPWLKHQVALFWLLQPLALGHWLLYRAWFRRRRISISTALPDAPEHQTRAA
jgi:hypothetical protein